MQFIQDACLNSLFISAVLTPPYHKPYRFNWDRIRQHSSTFNPAYNYEDAQLALQLSFIVTDSTAFGLPMNIPNWLQSIELKYDTCPLELISKGIANSGYNEPAPVAFIFYNSVSNVLFIVFVGTINVCLGALDMKYAQVEYDIVTNYVPGLCGHGGIYAVYKSIRNKLVTAVAPFLERNPQIIITGHSLGGGLSQICALELAAYNPIHYSFAAPMIFNNVGYDIFTRAVKHSYRVANASDLVTIAPLPVMPNKDAFFHVGELIYFQRNFGSYEKNHTQAYVEEYNLVV